MSDENKTLDPNMTYALSFHIGPGGDTESVGLFTTGNGELTAQDGWSIGNHRHTSFHRRVALARSRE